MMTMAAPLVLLAIMLEFKQVEMTNLKEKMLFFYRDEEMKR